MQLPVATTFQAYKHLFRLLSRHRNKYLLALFCQILSAIGLVAVPAIAGKIVDNWNSGYTVIWQLAITTLVVGLLGALFGILGNYKTSIVSQLVFADMRDELVDSLINLPLSQVEAAGSSDLLGRTSHDIENIQFFVRFGVVKFIQVFLMLIWILIIAFLLSPLAALPMILGVPLVFLILIWYVPRAIPANTAISTYWGRISALATEASTSGITIDSFGINETHRKNLDEAYRRTLLFDGYSAYLRHWLIFVIVLATFMPVVLCALWGIWIYQQELISAGTVSAIVLYTFQLRSPISEGAYWYDEFQRAAVSFKRVFGLSEILTQEVELQSEPVNRELKVESVNFSYLPGKTVLHDVNLTIKPGERLAIVGASGSGKSTLARLIMGISKPDNGYVTLGGVDVSIIRESKSKQSMLIVTQENHIFVGSIADNLLLVSPNASEDELVKALKQVQAWNWVQELPEGIHTKVGSDGMHLPESQNQQLALARIVLLNPHTLILDEATSMIDPAGARALEKSLNAVLAGRTVITIAHRLWSAQDNDRVVVMDNGRIIENGSHDELLKQDGHYKHLWELWSSE